MKKINFFTVSSLIFLFVCFSFTKSLYAQQSLSNSFSKNIQFGGGLGLNFGSGFTDVSVAPSAIYNINPIVALGASLQFGYIKVKNSYETYTYGGSLIGLLNPIPQIQLSAELEQLRFNTDFRTITGNIVSDNFWNTALYVGAGYRSNNVTIGIRYDLLHDDNKSIYSEAFMPFVRVYF
ncbi:hypothetical protein SAMN05444143_104114 [Flavobacterium succinicans]|uniref:Alpha-ketoglutarate decarboxylase n=1 Tax=Flavobacterium succinicans TaxID=29536 RepID=A0A1I4V3Y6_9FLAO|nr:hypothetical protein [Flavobacterium succinicans]SFM95833.1 hypothetical protein SAMN05444143_104114 [Flavobacterium succinicans]